MVVFLLCVGFSSICAQQLYDSEGHFIADKCPDGKMDRYVYDSSWQLIKFLNREGLETDYWYDSNGTMKTLLAPQQ